MRVGFLGKGGSGKTALSTSFARYLSSIGESVWYIDCDVNQHGSERLGIRIDTVPALADNLLEIKKYLAGNNTRISNPTEMQKTTPPGRGSRLFNSLHDDAGILSLISRSVVPNLRVFRTGTVTSDQVGHKCHHYSVGAAELVLTHTNEGTREWIVCDLAAGTDVFASPLFSYLDVLLVVCTPSIYSLEVLDCFTQRELEFGYKIGLILNRWKGNRFQKIREELDQTCHMYAQIADDSYFDDLEEWVLDNVIRTSRTSDSCVFEQTPKLPEHLVKEMAKLKSTITQIAPNRDRLLQQVQKYHRLNCESWANSYIGKDLTDQIDPDFSYPKLL